MRQLVVCLDGTWNVVDHTTNVWRVYTLLSSTDRAGNAQLKYYDEGVGSRWYDSVTGGAFGAGVYRTVKRAYNWLCEAYQHGDQVHLFGFSRGALTALSLANLIDRCGLIGPSSPRTFEDAYRMYESPGFERGTRASNSFRGESADLNAVGPLAFLGLFDTVSSLFARRLTGESMHKLSLPDSVKYVFHALAIDENRRPFASVRFPSAPSEGRLCERWFSGAHANIGGRSLQEELALEGASTLRLPKSEIPVRSRESRDRPEMS